MLVLPFWPERPRRCFPTYSISKHPQKSSSIRNPFPPAAALQLLRSAPRASHFSGLRAAAARTSSLLPLTGRYENNPSTSSPKHSKTNPKPLLQTAKLHLRRKWRLPPRPVPPAGAHVPAHVPTHVPRGGRRGFRQRSVEVEGVAGSGWCGMEVTRSSKCFSRFLRRVRVAPRWSRWDAVEDFPASRRPSFPSLGWWWGPALVSPSATEGFRAPPLTRRAQPWD